MKLIKSRRNFNCGLCKSEVKKGDMYFKKSERIGTSYNNNGYFQADTFVVTGFTLVHKCCTKCLPE